MNRLLITPTMLEKFNKMIRVPIIYTLGQNSTMFNVICHVKYIGRFNTLYK